MSTSQSNTKACEKISSIAGSRNSHGIVLKSRYEHLNQYQYDEWLFDTSTTKDTIDRHSSTTTIKVPVP